MITLMTAKSSIYQASLFVDHLTKKINIFSTVRLLSNSLDLFQIHGVLKYNYEAKKRDYKNDSEIWYLSGELPC